MTPSKAIRILVVDDHPVVCFGLSAIIESQPDMSVVAKAGDGAEAVTLFRKHKPDVTLMDLRMPQMGGVEAIRRIRQDQPKSVFIVLTTYNGDEDIHKALAAGAQGYMLKGMPHQELLDAIRSVHSGSRHLSEPVRQTLAEHPEGSDLTGRELQIVQLIVKGLSNRQIATALGITEGTVKWHINIILSRLNVADRTQAAVAALNRGIVEL